MFNRQRSGAEAAAASTTNNQCFLTSVAPLSSSVPVQPGPAILSNTTVTMAAANCEEVFFPLRLSR